MYISEENNVFILRKRDIGMEASEKRYLLIGFVIIILIILGVVMFHSLTSYTLNNQGYSSQNFEQAKFFIEQKPVNRSIYYDIFGSAPGELSEIKLAHDLTLHLNNNENSPIRGMIKLLGRGNGLSFP